MPQKNKKSPKFTLKPGKHYLAGFEVKKDSVFIEFPREIIDYLETQENNLSWMVINGTLQLTSNHGFLPIPVARMSEGEYERNHV